MLLSSFIYQSIENKSIEKNHTSCFKHNLNNNNNNTSIFLQKMRSAEVIASSVVKHFKNIQLYTNCCAINSAGYDIVTFQTELQLIYPIRKNLGKIL